MSPLLGGEIVIVFLVVRITLWVWRSRGAVGAILHGDEPPPHGGVPLAIERPRPALRLAARPPAERPACLPRAA